jgi:ribosomal-protein-alanine N-acetyltransferase
MPLGARLVHIEPLEPSDIVAVAQCLVIDADVFPYASVTFGARWRHSRVWVARDEGRRVAGFVGSIQRGAETYVEAIGVDPTQQRRGIGRALLQAAVEDARSARSRTAYLHVSVGNGSAIELYLSMGFVQRRRVRDFYRPGLFEAGNDAFEMALEL